MIIKTKQNKLFKKFVLHINFPAQDVSLDKLMEIKYSCGLTAFVSGALQHYA